MVHGVMKFQHALENNVPRNSKIFLCLNLIFIFLIFFIIFFSFPDVKNGFIVDSTRQYFYGDEARVQCYKGYKLTGSNIIKCDTNEEFDSAPTCDGK